MAFAGRLRSNISVFLRILRTESVLAQRTVPQRSSGIPDFALAEVCLGMTVECRLRSAPLRVEEFQTCCMSVESSIRPLISKTRIPLNRRKSNC